LAECLEISLDANLDLYRIQAFDLLIKMNQAISRLCASFAFFPQG